MSLQDWLVVALACLGGAVSPGPSLALVIRHALQSTRGGLACAWAHALGVGVYAALAATGLALLLTRHPLLDIALSLFAGLWLLRLCRLGWAEAGLPSEPAQATRSALRDGLSMGLVNPKVALFFVALFTAALPDEPSATAQGQAVITALVIDGLWYSLVCLALQAAGMQAHLQRYTALLARFSALILGAFAVTLLLRVGWLLGAQYW